MNMFLTDPDNQSDEIDTKPATRRLRGKFFAFKVEVEQELMRQLDCSLRQAEVACIDMRSAVNEGFLEKIGPYLTALNMIDDIRRRYADFDENGELVKWHY